MHTLHERLQCWSDTYHTKACKSTKEGKRQGKKGMRKRQGRQYEKRRTQKKTRTPDPEQNRLHLLTNKAVVVHDTDVARPVAGCPKGLITRCMLACAGQCATAGPVQQLSPGAAGMRHSWACGSGSPSAVDPAWVRQCQPLAVGRAHVIVDAFTKATVLRGLRCRSPHVGTQKQAYQSAFSVHTAVHVYKQTKLCGP